MKLLFVVFLGILCRVSSFKLGDPKQPGVSFGDISGGVQQIYIDESNTEGRVNVAQITEVKGEIKLSIRETQDVINQIALQVDNGADVTQKWLSMSLLDYEMLKARGFQDSFLSDMTDDGESGSLNTVNLHIVNLDDESPTLSTVSCEISENTPTNVDNSVCVLTVGDPDGFLSTMDFSAIVGTRGEEDLFELKYKDVPNDNVYETSVYLVLKDGLELDYEEVTLYSFHIEAKDAAGHATTPLASVQAIVQVKDLPDEPPIWDSFISARTITEKLATEIQVSAKDGDYGINSAITYSISNPPDVIHIDETTGKITVDPIDRDAGTDQVKFTVVATEVDEPHATLSGEITLIVEDVDDSIPAITVTGSTDHEVKKEIPEDSTQITDLQISANDLDLGANALYNVELLSDNAAFLAAFQIIPANGYKETPLSLSIIRPDLLDFENPDWRTITLTLHTYGTNDPTNEDSLPITITLSDVNDEPPKFSEDSYTIDVFENVPIDHPIFSIQATDADAYDIEHGLKHVLLGTLANTILTIEEGGGDVTTKIANAFDYEKQNEVYVQIQASDNADPVHTATVQLTINVQDVNDEDPRLFVTSAIEISENQADGFVIDDKSVTATDEDTSAQLEFHIDWERSYVTKNSKQLPPVECIKVETVPKEGDIHQVSAKFTLIEVEKGSTPDYEKYDNLYIQLVVTDLKTEEGDGTDTALIVISILDVNDNAPVFLENTESAPRSVLDAATSGSPITSVTATDADVGDSVRYSIESADPANTPEWVEIDEETGNIVVAADVIIDCDDPVRDSLVYTVTATDGVHNKMVDITIDIVDQNDNSPTLGDQSTVIPEDNGLEPETTQDGKILITLNPQDKDRDEAFHTVRCRLVSDSDEVANRFTVDADNNIVVSLQNGLTLDYEAFTQYNFTLNCVDNPPGVSQVGTTSLPVYPPPVVSIQLTDVNDHYPSVDTKSIPGVSENTKKGPISTTLIGKDDDSDVNGNGLMEFAIKRIQRFLDADHQNEVDGVDQSLFSIETADNKKEATLSVTADDLSGNYGFLQLTITTTDLGNPPLSADRVVDLEVAKFNFLQPKFNFPDADTTYYFKKLQNANSRLVMWNDDIFPYLQADDQQGGKYLLSFQVVDDSSGNGLFRTQDLANSQGDLQMTTGTFTAQPYTLRIMTYIKTDVEPSLGEALYNQNVTINVDFFDQDTTDPTFEHHQGTVDFLENSMIESYKVESASYPDVAIPDLPIFYLLRSGDETIFTIDANTGNVTLLQALDFETNPSYPLVIQSSNKDSTKPDAIDETKFQLTVNVKDVNDNEPIFEQDGQYFATLLTTVDNTNTVTVKEVVANDLDTTSAGKVRYNIVSSNGSTDSIKNIQDPFKIPDSSSGRINLNFQVRDTMSGYFTLTVSATDEPPESHRADAVVKIFIVTSANTVNFKFQNEQNMVIAASANIKAVLDDEFHYETNVETAKNDGNGTTPTSLVPIFFLDLASNEPVQGTTIKTKITNVQTFKRLQTAFAKYSLNLLPFDNESADTENLENILKAWLIGVSVVLGSLCLILLIAFILKTRALNQRINKLSNTKFGSQESGMNRTGVADAPTTNKHALEGSNPVYNNDMDSKDLDQISVRSGDSDLIGVEDDDKFNYNFGDKDDMNE